VAQQSLPVRTYASAGAVVVDPGGKHLLVLLRPARLGPSGKAEVRLPKGHVEPGETRGQAALREVREETGLRDLAIQTDLGHQLVEYEWRGRHYIRDESCFLVTYSPDVLPTHPEKQFERLWLSWEEALERITFEAERAWVRRARAARGGQGGRGDSVP
jgi:8-oxo-dGTP pyrophosphatase MutT (NUDIX family)